MDFMNCFESDDVLFFQKEKKSQILGNLNIEFHIETKAKLTF